MLELQVILGGVVSLTVTPNVQLLDLFGLSVAVQVTLLVPRRTPVPEGGAQITGTAFPAESVAVTLKLTGVRPPVHSATMLLGQRIVGGGASTTVTLKLQELELPALSTAVQGAGGIPPREGTARGEQAKLPQPPKALGPAG